MGGCAEGGCRGSTRRCGTTAQPAARRPRRPPPAAGVDAAPVRPPLPLLPPLLLAAPPPPRRLAPNSPDVFDQRLQAVAHKHHGPQDTRQLAQRPRLQQPLEHLRAQGRARGGRGGGRGRAGVSGGRESPPAGVARTLAWRAHFLTAAGAEGMVVGLPGGSGRGTCMMLSHTCVQHRPATLAACMPLPF